MASHLSISALRFDFEIGFAILIRNRICYGIEIDSLYCGNFKTFWTLYRIKPIKYSSTSSFSLVYKSRLRNSYEEYEEGDKDNKDW